MIAGTVVNRNWLPYARVVAESFLKHHPKSRFIAFVIEEPGGRIGRPEGFETVFPHEMGIDGGELHRRAACYDARGLACSLKPAAVRHLLSQEQGVAILTDADTCVYGQLDGVADAASRSGIALTPHRLQSGDSGDDVIAEQAIVKYGTFNTGLIGISSRAGEFLDWWDRRTRRDCVDEPGEGAYLDQKWVELVPCLFEYELVRDPGCNVAGWNLGQRELRWAGDHPTIDGEPLRHFHFAAGFDPMRPDALTQRWDVGTAPVWFNAMGDPAAERLMSNYANRLLDAGYEAASNEEGAFSRITDGTRLDDAMRRAYATALKDAEPGRDEPPPNPFRDAVAFRDWLRAPHPAAGESPPISRYLVALRELRGDLVAAFRWIPGSGAHRLHAWARDAARRGEIPEAMAPAPLPAIERFQRIPRAAAARIVPGRGASGRSNR